MMWSYELFSKIRQNVGDSWYFIDIKRFENNYSELIQAFKEIYPSTQIAYSYKTNYIPEICQIAHKMNGMAEVVSEMEYDLAIRLNVEPHKIIINGPWKPEKALEKYFLKGSIVNLDSFSEARTVFDLTFKYPDQTFNIGLRCNFEFPGIELSRFGFDVESNEFFQLITEIYNTRNIRLINLHCHFPNRDVQFFNQRVERMIVLFRRVYRNNFPLWIDIGGGLGGKLDDFLKKQIKSDIGNYKEYASIIATRFSEEFKQDLIKPLLVLEPGTALVADTMSFVCQVVEIKKVRGRFIAITNGSKVNFHPMASKINVPMKVVFKPGTHRIFYSSIDISGYTCMEGDYLFYNFSGELGIGDYLVFDNVGSYSIVFKPPFIMPNVPVVSMQNDEIVIIKEAETFSSIFHSYTLLNG